MEKKPDSCKAVGTLAGVSAEERVGKGTAGAWVTAISLLPSGIAIAWLVSKTQWFWMHRPDLQFGWIVLMLCGYLFWEAWERKPDLCDRWTLSTLVLAAGGLGLLFVVQMYQAAFGLNSASLAGLACGIMALIAANLHYLFGWVGIRHFAFTFAFLLVALPMPSAIQNPLVGGLQSSVAFLNVEILRLLGIPAQQIGSVIKLPGCIVGVDEACSGIRSLQSTIMATLFIGYLTLRRASLKILLLLAGIGLAVIGNVGRSLFLSYTANQKGLQALEAFHDPAGWSILTFTAAGVILVTWLLNRAESAIQARPLTAPLSPSGRDNQQR